MGFFGGDKLLTGGILFIYLPQCLVSRKKILACGTCTTKQLGYKTMIFASEELSI